LALTDADRLQMTAVAMMRHSVFTGKNALIAQPVYTQSFSVTDYLTPNFTFTPGDYVSAPAYSYTIT